jgi:hypothetical protein
MRRPTPEVGSVIAFRIRSAAVAMACAAGAAIPAAAASVGNVFDAGLWFDPLHDRRGLRRCDQCHGKRQP